MRSGLFIGLGGTGTMTVAYVKAKLRDIYKAEGRLDQFDSENCFLCIDTDLATIDKIRKTPGLGDDILDMNSDFISLGNVNPYLTYHHANSHTGKKERLEAWAVNPERWTNTTLSEGAKASRQIGRSTLVNNSDEVLSRLRAKLNLLRSFIIKRRGMDNRGSDGSNTPNSTTQTSQYASTPLITVFSSGTGGTGSSILLDILLYIDKTFKSLFTGEDPYLRLFLFMSRPFLEKNPHNSYMPLNSFALYSELNQMYEDYMFNEGKSFSTLSVIDINARFPGQVDVKTSPFKFVIPIDNMLGQKSFSVEELPEITANISTYLHIGTGSDSISSKFDNDLAGIAENRSLRANFEDDKLWYPYLVPVGFRRIKKPNEELKTYIKTRLKYEILQYGLRGSNFVNVHTDEVERKKVVDNFVNNNIFKYINRENRVSGLQNIDSDYRKNLFQSVGIDNDIIIIPEEQHKKLNEYWFAFQTIVNDELDKLRRSWSDNTSMLSKKRYLDLIMEDVRTDTESKILQFGFRYAEGLIGIADDKKCTDYILSCEEKRTSLNETVQNDKIEEILKFAKKGKKNLAEYQTALVEFAELRISQLINEFKIEILYDLTETNKGLLETFRKTSYDGKGGLAGYINYINAEIANAKYAYEELAKSFAITLHDVTTEYYPPLAPMTSATTPWKTHNLFSDLYNVSVVEAETTTPPNTLGDYIPIRQSSDASIHSLEEVLKELHHLCLLPGEAYYFCQEKNLDPRTKQSDIIDAFVDEDKLDKFISNSLLTNHESELYKWLDKSLEATIDERDLEYLSDDLRQKTELMFGVTYPVSGVTERAIYVGQSERFAENFGYNRGGIDVFVPNETVNDDSVFYKIRMVPGYTFRAYNGYDAIYNPYINERDKNFSNYFPHIHKDLKDKTMSELGLASFDDDIILIALFESIKRALKKSDSTNYNRLFDGGMGSEASGLNRFSSATSSDRSFFEFNLHDGNNATVNIATKIDFQGGKIKVVEQKHWNIKAINFKASILFDEILIGYTADLNNLRKTLYDGLKKLQVDNKQILREYIENNMELIVEEFDALIGIPIQEKGLTGMESERKYMSSLYDMVPELKIEIIQTLS
ncbi:MAG TPA: hypothetical protein GX007_00935 [Bacteroidales bacterium]|nr:hypothetical protein [Bacteroidales bacterium]